MNEGTRQCLRLNCDSNQPFSPLRSVISQRQFQSISLLVAQSPARISFPPLTRDCNLTMTMTYMHRHQQLRLLPQKSLDLVNGNARPGITSNPPLPFSRQRHRRFICCFCITSSSSSSSLRCRVGHLILAVPSPHNHLPSMQIFLRRCAQNHVFHGKGPLEPLFSSRHQGRSSCLPASALGPVVTDTC